MPSRPGSTNSGNPSSSGGNPQQPFRGLRILVIEDDHFFQEYVHDILSQAGAESQMADDGEAGLHLAVTSRPDLILADVEIPKLHGFVLLRQLRSRKETANIPIILMSGKVEKEVFERHAQMRERADGYLVKPFSAQDLLVSMAKALSPAGRALGGGAPPQPATQSALPLDAAPGGERPPRVLVVDDSPHIRTMVGNFLRENGVEVVEAADGKAGLSRTMELRPDAVLLDVQMPHLNGFVVCELLKKAKETNSIPIIIMSAVADEETFRKHAKLKNRADAYLQKPFKKGDLLALLARLTGHKAFSSRVEEKASYVLPPPEALGPSKGAAAPPSAEAPGPSWAAPSAAASRKMEEMVEAMKAREKALMEEMERSTRERDAALEEAQGRVKAAELKEKETGSRLALAMKRLEGLEEKAALAGKSEEDRQAREREAAQREKELRGQVEALGKAKQEGARLAEEERNRAREAEARANEAAAELEKLRKATARETAARRELEGQVKALSAQRATAAEAATSADAGRLAELEGKLSLLAADLSQSKKLAARETAARMEAESRSLAAVQERDLLKKEAASLKTRLENASEAGSGASRLREELAHAGERIRELEAVASSHAVTADEARLLLEKEIGRLGARLKEEQARGAEAESLREFLASAENKARDLEERLNGEVESRRQAETQGAEARRRIDALTGQLAESEELRTALEERLSKAGSDRESISTEVARLRRELAEARTGGDQARKSLQDAEKVIEGEKAARAAAEGVSASLRKELEGARGALAARDEELAAEARKLQAAAAERDRLAEEGAGLTATLARAEEREKALQGAVAGHEQKERDLLRDLAAEKSGRAEAEGALAGERKRLAELQAAREKLEAELREKADSLHAVGEEVHHKGTELADIREKLAQTASRLEKLQGTLGGETEKGKALLGDLGKEREARAQVEAQLADARKKLEEATRSRDALSKGLEGESGKGKALVLDLEKERAARGQAESVLAETRKKLEETVRLRETLEKQLAQSQQKGQETAQAREGSDKSLAEARQKLAEALKARESLEKSLAEEKARTVTLSENLKKAEKDGSLLRQAVEVGKGSADKTAKLLMEKDKAASDLSAALAKEKTAREQAEKALAEAKKAAEVSAAEVKKRQALAQEESAKAVKETDEARKRLAAGQEEEKKLSARLSLLEKELTQAKARQAEVSSEGARLRGMLETALREAQQLVAAPAGGREGLDALVKSLQGSLAGGDKKGGKVPRPPSAGPGKGVWAAAVAAALVLGVGGGYLVAPRRGAAPPASPAAAGPAEQAAPAPAPEVPSGPALIEYSKAWSRQTVEGNEAVGFGVQATVHTPREGELGVRLAAQQEKWGDSRLQEGIGQAARVLGERDNIYVTVLVKDGTSPAPGLKDLVKRLMVKDPWGKMVPATVTASFNSSRVLEDSLLLAVRTPNPDYAEADGITVAFPRRGLRLEANTLHLVLAPSDTDPGRPLVTWDLTGWGE